MSRRAVMIVVIALFLLGAAIRVHNALTFPVLGSYDAFGHFTYVWYLAETWRVPLPTAGWGFFHPPLYYAAMAAIWNALPDLDPIARLRVGILALAVASLVHAVVVWDLLRRRFPEDVTLRVFAAGLMLLLPVHLYGAAFLGNESLTAVLCSVAFWLLLAQARRPTWTRTVLLGLVLGLAMLAKATAIALVAAALGTLAWKVRRERAPRVAAQLALTIAIIVTTCGWYYARNIERYGTPLVMSREQLMVRMVESSHPQARRSLAEYLLFDPTIFRRPAWPRSGGNEPEPEGLARALRDSVWTGLYANAWFDGFGGWTVPRVTDSELARRCGQALLALGIVPTLLVLVGMFAALAQLRRQGWDDLLGVTVLTLGGMILIFVIGTRAAPIAAAVKATYFIPVAPAFGVCLALGLARLRARWPAAVPLVAVELAVTGVLAAVVFWHGLLFDARTIRGYFPMIDASEANLYGVVAYAGGERDAARRLFGEAADAGLYLGYENLALLALDDGNPGEALHLMKRALRLQPAQSFGLAADRAEYDRATRAEHLNLVAVITQQLGRPTRVRRAAAAALRLDPMLPEAHYDLAVAILDAAGPDVVPAAPEVAEVCRHLERALALDPGFGEARALLAATRVQSSACVTTALPPTASGRLYPVETGIGAPHAASIGRRRHVAAPRAAAPPIPSRQSQT